MTTEQAKELLKKPLKELNPEELKQAKLALAILANNWANQVNQEEE